MTTVTDRILTLREGACLTITFNNPDRLNAMSKDMWLAAADLLNAAGEDDTVRVVILTGAGDRAFVAGADISKFADERANFEAQLDYGRAVEAMHMALKNLRKPTIARVNGYCIGGGLAIAIDCDLRLVSDKSTFAVPAAKLGLGYAASGVRTLRELVGPAFTAEIFYTARQFTAEDARIMGLVNRVVPEAELDGLVAQYVETIANNAPLTIAAVKQTIIELGKPDAGQDLELCRELVETCFSSEDYQEGRLAFMEKRKPRFQGR